MMTLKQASNWVSAPQLVGESVVDIKRVTTDTRSLQPGDLFVALKGDKFDAHDFLTQAKASGAVAAIAEHGLVQAGLSGLQVSDSKQALGQLAGGWRSQFELPLIAVTGSNGKTTVTQMVASILQAFKPAQSFATKGNLNNDIGVPLTLLGLTNAHRIGVVELGMNHPGEIALLAHMVKPAVALVNNAQREHLEFMGTVEAVAHENGAVIDALGADGVAVFPADDDYTPVWKQKSGLRPMLTFAMTGDADVTANAVWTGALWEVAAKTPRGPLAFTLDIAGEHNVKNALAATACALAAGIPLECISQGLSGFEPVKGRSHAVRLQLKGHHFTLIDDTYNANPDSMRAAIDVLAALPGPRLLVMGDMGEVGHLGPHFHEEAGRWAHAQGIRNLFTFGPQSILASQVFVSCGPGQGQHFESITELMAAVARQLQSVSSVLVKGSRFMKMERVVMSIQEQVREQDQERGVAC